MAKRCVFSLLMILLTALAISPAQARARRQIVVNSLEDSATTACGEAAALCTLRSALHTAHSGDTITFSVRGFIHLTRLLTVDTPGAIRLVGPGAATLTLSGDKRVPVLSVSAGTSLTLSGLTLADGQGMSDANGAVYAGGATNTGSLTLIDSAVQGNQAAPAELLTAGGIYSSGPLTLIRTSVANNHAAQGVGGVLASGSALDIEDSQITANTGSRVGGLYAFGSPLTLVRSVVRDNRGRDIGGLLNAGTGRISASQIVANVGSGDSPNSVGGLANDANATLTIQDSRITANIAGGNPQIAAGGLFNYGGATLTITGSQITDNHAMSGVVQAAALYNAALTTLLDTRIDMTSATCAIVNDTGLVTVSNPQTGRIISLPMNTCAIQQSNQPLALNADLLIAPLS